MNMQRRVYQLSRRWGFDPLLTVRNLAGLIKTRKSISQYEKQRKSSPDPSDFPQGKKHLIYTDRFENAGAIDGHYFIQDLLVARAIFDAKPIRHVDIGSRLDGFVAHVASFREIEVIDIRPLNIEIPGIRFIQMDLMAPVTLPGKPIDSISCLHALEHFGLGRYGDEIDYYGWEKGLENIACLLSPGGYFYLSLPTGMKQHVNFKAHRVFSIPFLELKLSKYFEVEYLAFIDDTGNLHEDIEPNSQQAVNAFGSSYGCSIWVLRRRTAPQEL